MSGKVVPSTATADPLLGTGSRPPQAEIKPIRPVDPSEKTAGTDLRLIIEETGEPGQYVYTIVDRRTGRIVSRLRRDQVMRLREQSDYAAGDVFDAKA